MNQIFTARAVEQIRRFFSANYRVLCCPAILFCTSLTVDAQNATFFETFDSTPMGEVPEGWTWYSLGGGGGANWVRTTYGFFGPPIMSSGVEHAMPGEIDQDWLITPQITPATGDQLIFDAGQEYVWDDYGSTYLVLISVATSNRADFADTLASWTEPEFPGYLFDQRLILDLSAYEGIPIYIAFLHNNPVTAEGDPSLPPPPTENWYLDNVEVRPVRPLDYSGAEIFGSFNDVIRVATSKTSVIISAIVRATGDTGSANITSMTFSTAGSSDKVRIKEATLYTTYGDSFIATSEDDGTVQADIYGTVVDPGSTFTFVGDQQLERGDTYFWLMYTLEADEADLVYPYPEVDATFDKVVVNQVEHATTVPSTEGAHPVVPHVPVNDNYADAIELAPTGMPARYGSYNLRATFETEFERLAYCATSGSGDGSNSVWWHFRAPTEGMITVDLSACDFNTLLLIQDANLDQLACNKDIDEAAFVFQSKIADFQVEGGKDYYIRVTGEGAYPGDPNSASGVVHLDFSFTTPTGIEEGSEYPISALYPNPAGNIVYTDLVLTRPTEVVFDIIDMMGQPVLSDNKGLLGAGVHKQLPLDTSTLPPGTYTVVLGGTAKGRGRKLIVLK